MNTWKVILATLVIFGTGVFTGGLLVHHTSQTHARAGRQTAARTPARPETAVRNTNRVYNPPGPLMPGLRKDFLKNLDCELQLTTEQRTNIEKILCDGQECTKRLWDQIAPDMHQEWVRVRARIRAELTPEQRQRFDELMKRPRKPQAQQDQAPSTPEPNKL